MLLTENLFGAEENTHVQHKFVILLNVMQALINTNIWSDRSIKS
jgi:hypothetical protein